MLLLRNKLKEVLNLPCMHNGKLVSPNQCDEASADNVQYWFMVHYPRWVRMPPFMCQCWGLPRKLAQCMSPQGCGKLVNPALLSLMRHVCVYAVLTSSQVNVSAPLVCRHDRVTREARRVGLMGRDRGGVIQWRCTCLFILPSFQCQCFSRRLIQACMLTGHPATQYTLHCQPR